MRAPLFSLLALGALCAPVRGGLVPVSTFFADQAAEVFRLSPSGRKVAYLDFDGSSSQLRVGHPGDLIKTGVKVTGTNEGDVFSFLWLDEERLVFASRANGRSGCAIWVGQGSQAPRLLADFGTGISLQGVVLLDEQAKVLLAVPGDEGNDLFLADPDEGTRQLLFKNTAGLPVQMVNRNGKVLVGIRCSAEGRKELLTLKGDGEMVSLLRCAPGEMLELCGMSPDGETAYIITNHGEQVEYSMIEAVETATGKREFLAKDLLEKTDVAEPLFDRNGEALLGVRYLRERSSYSWVSDEMAQKFHQLSSLIGKGDIAVRDLSADRKKWVVSVVSDTEPEAEFFYDSEQGRLVGLSRRSNPVSDKSLGQMEPVEFAARDGKLIPGYLTLPPGAEKRDLPVVVFPHGGPNKRTFWGFDPRVQFFATRGYVVFQPNFRGSSGYGKRFQNAGDRQWGRGTMQDDITDGVKWLIASGIADPKRIAIVGGSYGGFAALAGLTFTPELYAAGVCLFGASDLQSFVRELPPSWKPLKGDILRRIGDPDVPEDALRMADQSPLYFVDRIKAPLMVYHGEKDNVISFGQSQRFVSKCHDKSIPVEFLVSSEGGHGFTDHLDEQAVYVGIERFLAAHLGGEAQMEIGVAVEERLKSLREKANPSAQHAKKAQITE